ncbi:MAG: 50S ribosome-binding GTPase [Oscillospiraceae bacterium]|jgi:GTPase SAR1 family protein|nr:50S ribosome-binding GTPase [Oscillospiraceae bacterium]
MLDNEFLSLPLIGHPMLNATDIAKSDYISILKTLVNMFAHGNTWSDASAAAYAEYFGVLEARELSESELAINIRNLTADRFSFRTFRITTFRHLLIFDVLFLVAYGNEQNGRTVTDFILPLLRKKHRKDVLKLIDLLYNTASHDGKFMSAKHLIGCWRQNSRFTELPLTHILVTATMSAGKSTLINTLFGDDVFAARNEVCTDRTQTVCNKPFRDGVVYRDGDSSALFSESLVGSRLCLIDTPGVNSARYPAHRDITRTTIAAGQYDLLLYIISATQIGVTDDDAHLRYVLAKKPPNVSIVFVLNKLDTFNEDDSVCGSIDRLRDRLIEYGIAEPLICPVSATVGRLAKKDYNNVPLSEIESVFYDAYIEAFGTPELDLSVYYPHETVPDKPPLYLQSGLAGLEQTILQISEGLQR